MVLRQFSTTKREVKRKGQDQVKRKRSMDHLVMESESESKLESARRPKKVKKARVEKERSRSVENQVIKLTNAGGTVSTSKDLRVSNHLRISSRRHQWLSMCHRRLKLKWWGSSNLWSPVLTLVQVSFASWFILTRRFDKVAEQVHRSVICSAQLLRLKDCLQYRRVSSGPTIQTLQPDQLCVFKIYDLKLNNFNIRVRVKLQHIRVSVLCSVSLCQVLPSRRIQRSQTLTSTTSLNPLAQNQGSKRFVLHFLTQ